MKTLHLTLVKKWFDMINSGDKKEEYREINEYWTNRLTENNLTSFKEFDVVEFSNRHENMVPSVRVECKGIVIGFGQTSLGAKQGKRYFIISLGEKVN